MRTTSRADSGRLSRRRLLQVGAAGFVGASMGALPSASAAIRREVAISGALGCTEAAAPAVTATSTTSDVIEMFLQGQAIEALHRQIGE